MTEIEPLRIVIADDQEWFRSGLRMVLDRAPGIVVVGEAADGFQAVAKVEQCRPDVILLDIQMPRLDGIEACRRIVSDQSNSTKVVMLTTFDHDEYVFAALNHGASAFLLKDHPLAELPAALRSISVGGSIFSATVTMKLVRSFVSKVSPDAIAKVGRLTDRERQVLALIAVGLSNPEIASTLFLSEATVKSHVRRILQKIEARDRVQAVITALQAGLDQ
jgi:DNA-binding NarL/FixJ family response regulator